ncbi:RDD family protein [Occultella kanbiaonis]|uniref:RDD family protein n=1 Tax=Occultella kanbiaonis TaxID=2675754 RepID=UPI0013D1406F|nr:RDD family protein [Occultella kanbiaonis]
MSVEVTERPTWAVQNGAGGAASDPAREPSGRRVASGVLRRLAAYAVDLAAVAALIAAVYLPTRSLVLGGIVGAEAIGALVLWEARTGRTLGKSLLGIRAARSDGPYAPGLGRELIRAALLGAAHLVAFVGQFALIATAAADRSGRGQALHDRVARTAVLDLRPDAVGKSAPVPGLAPMPSTRAVPGGTAGGRDGGAQGLPPTGAPAWAAQGSPTTTPAGYAPGSAATSAQGMLGATPGPNAAPRQPTAAPGPAPVAPWERPRGPVPAQAGVPAERRPAAGAPPMPSSQPQLRRPSVQGGSVPGAPWAAAPPQYGGGQAQQSAPQGRGPQQPTPQGQPGQHGRPPQPGPVAQHGQLPPQQGQPGQQGQAPQQGVAPQLPPQQYGRPAGPGQQVPATGAPAGAAPVAGYAPATGRPAEPEPESRRARRVAEAAAPEAPGQQAAASAQLPEHTFYPRAVEPARVPGLTDAPAPGGGSERRGAAPSAVYVLTMDDGATVTVTGSGLLGRRPQAPAGERYDHLVAIDDPGRSLSRTHARIGIEDGELWVEDRGSANGTLVVAADGTQTRAFPGKRVTVPEDGSIELGERVITVARWES